LLAGLLFGFVTLTPISKGNVAVTVVPLPDELTIFNARPFLRLVRAYQLDRCRHVDIAFEIRSQCDESKKQTAANGARLLLRSAVAVKDAAAKPRISCPYRR